MYEEKKMVLEKQMVEAIMTCRSCIVNSFKGEEAPKNTV